MYALIYILQSGPGVVVKSILGPMFDTPALHYGKFLYWY